jgi:pyruvate,water dikinase
MMPLSKEIEHKITGYPDEETFFIEKLASGVAKLLLHFIQIKPLCVFSDFKSNEYYNL